MYEIVRSVNFLNRPDMRAAAAQVFATACSDGIMRSQPVATARNFHA